jgi:hypothetical protein
MQMDQLESNSDAADEAVDRDDNSSKQRSGTFATIVGLVSGILSVCGFLYGVGWAILPSSTLTEKIAILCASSALTAAFALGIGAWKNLRLFVFSATSIGVAVASLAYLSIAVQDDAATQVARLHAAHTSGSSNSQAQPVAPPSYAPTGSISTQVSPTPEISSRSPAASATLNPIYLTNLTGSGSAWQNGSWSLGGKYYSRSLGVPDPCNGETSVTYRWSGYYSQFIATVGVTDAASPNNQNDPVNFAVYADASETIQLGTKSAQYARPAIIDVPLQTGETSITLDANDGGYCEISIAVWGDARIIP